MNVTDLAPDWRQERLPAQISSDTNNVMARPTTQTPGAESEVKPTLYEELKLGHEGAGFKRLVS